MPLLDKDVSTLFLENDGKMPLKTIFRLAIQMVSLLKHFAQVFSNVRISISQLFVLEYIHKCGYAHGDLKGSHILVGQDRCQSYLIDFNTAAPYAVRKFVPDPSKYHQASWLYSSVDAHLVNTILVR